MPREDEDEPLDDVDTGPEPDSGELDVADVDSAGESDDAGAEDEDGEDSDGALDDAADAADSSAEEETPEVPPPAALNELESARQQLVALSQLAAAQQKALQELQQPKPQPSRGLDPVLVQSVRVLMSGDEKAIAALPPEARLRAGQWVREENEAQIRHRMDPEADYRERMARFVEGHVQYLLQQHLGPMQGLLERDRQGQINAILAPHQPGFAADPSLKRRVAEKLQLFQMDHMSATEVQHLLNLVVTSTQVERAQAGLGKKAQTVATKEEQIRSNKEQRRRLRGNRGRKGRRSAPDLDDFQNDLVGYAQALEQHYQEQERE